MSARPPSAPQRPPPPPPLPVEHKGCRVGGILIPREIHPLGASSPSPLLCTGCNAEVQGSAVEVEIAWMYERARNAPRATLPPPPPPPEQLALLPVEAVPALRSPPLSDPLPDPSPEPPPLAADVERAVAPLRRRIAPDGRSFLAIIAYAARIEGASLEAVLSADRHKSVAAARRRAYHDLRHLTGASYQDLAEVFGRADHQPVLTLVRLHEQAIAKGTVQPTPPVPPRRPPSVAAAIALPPVRGNLAAELAARRLPKGGPTWYELAVDVCRRTGVDPVAFCRPGRGQNVKLVVRARHVVWEALRKAGYSYPEIAAPWGADDSTVVGALQELAAKRAAPTPAPTSPAPPAAPPTPAPPPASPPRPLAAGTPPPAPSSARVIVDLDGGEGLDGERVHGDRMHGDRMHGGATDRTPGDQWYEPDPDADAVRMG
jgi:hypothetical protein